MGIGQRLERLEKTVAGRGDPLIIVTGDADVPDPARLAELGIAGGPYRVMRLHGPETGIMFAPNGLAEILRKIDGRTRDVLSGRRTNELRGTPAGADRGGIRSSDYRGSAAGH